MNSKYENETLVIYLEGRIDTTNVDKVSAEIDAVRAQYPGKSPILDVENLLYISSAGLRMVLRIRKEAPGMKVVNASAEVYDIFEMTGFTEMIPIEKAYKQFSVDGCTVIGQGAKGTVYRYNEDTIIKVYKNPDSLPDIKRERELARKAFILGIPTAISYDVVKVGESFGSVFELLDAKSYSQLLSEDPANCDKYISEYTELLRKIHGTMVKADDMPDIKIFVRDWLKLDRPHMPKDVGDKLEKLIDETPDTLNMLHCDYHTNNVMLQNGETLLIDMDTLSHGHPVFELANVYITYVGFGEFDPSNVEKFLGIPYKTATYVWEKFLPQYLGTSDKARITEVGNKVRLVNYIRLMRHNIRRLGADNEECKKIITYCNEKIAGLLETVDTLDF